jgi:hypothetical protein
MRLLIINAFDETKRGIEAFNDFKRCVLSCLREARGETVASEENIVVRKPFGLADYIIDYAFEMLDDRAKDITLAFDNLDMIFIGGDMTYMPWDPKCSQVVTLLATARKVNKPVLCCGSGAFMMVYSICTGGTKFHVLNAPYGENIDRLPAFSRYSPATGQYPGAWLNNNNGDLYSYDVHKRVWAPVCNCGIFRENLSNTQSKNYPKVAGNNGKNRIAHIYSLNSHREYLTDLFTNNIPVPLVSDTWSLGWTGKLPSKLKIETLAEGPNGPLFLTVQNSLVLACEIKDTPTFPPTRKLIVNYFANLKKQIDRSKSGKVFRSLHDYLFVTVSGTGRCAFELDVISQAEQNAIETEATGHEPLRPNVAPPVGGGFPVGSTLPTGPVRVDAPVMTMMFSKATKATPTTSHLTSDGGKHTGHTREKALHSNFQNPKLLRRHRLEKLLTETWNYKPEKEAAAYNIDGNVMASGPRPNDRRMSQLEEGRAKNNRVIRDLLDQCATIGFKNPGSQQITDTDIVADNELPESARDLFSGMFFDETNVKHRSRGAPNTAGSGLNQDSMVNYSTSLVENSIAASHLSHAPFTESVSQSHVDSAAGKTRVPPMLGWKQSISEQSGASRQRPLSGSSAKKFTAEGISARLVENHLVYKHPNSARMSSKHAGKNMSPPKADGRGPSAQSSREAGKDYSMYAPFTHQEKLNCDPMPIQLPSHHTGPFNNLKKFETMDEKIMADVALSQSGKKLKVPYEGAYKGSFQTERERDMAAAKLAKEKFLGGSFKSAFGVASAIPLRDKGVVQSTGPYRPVLEHPPDEQKDRIIAGPWRPTKIKPSGR